MGKIGKAFAFMLILTIAISSQSLLFVKPTSANMVFVPTEPITDPPVLEVNSPIDNSRSGTSVLLNITVTKPTSWGPSENPHTYYNTGIAYIHYVLDGTTHSLFEAQLINPIPQDMLPTISNFSVTLKELTNGTHSLQIVIYALNQWCPTTSSLGSVPPFYFYNMTVTSDIIHFTVGAQATSPSPTVPELPWLAIVPLLLSVFAVAMVLRHRKLQANLVSCRQKS
ncbi:MAG: hypothetical protein ACQCN6_04980 [Candidatus Bathyarchaeia archaeon]